MAIVNNRKTNLEMVQAILTHIDGDQITAITDTIEAQQIFEILQGTYFDLMSNREWAHNDRMISPFESSSHIWPNVVRFQIDIHDLVALYVDSESYCYNNTNAAWGTVGDSYSYSYRTDTATYQDDNRHVNWKKLTYLSPEDFLDYTNKRDTRQDRFKHVNIPYTKTNVRKHYDTPADPLTSWHPVSNERQAVASIINDEEAEPKYYTSFDDDRIVIDAARPPLASSANYSAFGSCNIKALVKSLVFFDDDPEAIQEMPAKFFQLWLHKSIASVSSKLRQVVDQTSEVESRRIDNYLSQKQRQVGGGPRIVSFGRRKRGSIKKHPTFESNQ